MLSPDLVPLPFIDGAERAASAIAGMDNLLLAAHVNLDGDALGSLGAMGFILQKLGRRFAIYSSTGVPPYLGFLTLPGKVCRNLAEAPFKPENAIYLDCGVPDRLGPELEPIAALWPSVNIDHHLGGDGMGTIANFVAPEAAATAQLVAYVADVLDVPLAGNLADCVALGLMTDTGGFCHGNTTAEVFSLCASLARNGCDIPGIREKLQNSWTIGRMHLWGRLFCRAVLKCEGRVAFCSVSLEDLREFQCSREDMEGCVEWLRRIHGVRVAALLREDENDRCKFSLRSWGEVDVRSIAAALGGGGHRNAAGGSLPLPCAEAGRVLVETIEKYLNEEEPSP